MKRTVMTTDGKKDSDIELPNVFETEVNRALIHRAFINLQTHGFQTLYKTNSRNGSSCRFK